MYFQSRAEAGRLLAEQLVPLYRYDDCVVVALGEGGVQVAEPIAAGLHAVMTMLVAETIPVPGESIDFGGVGMDGSFTFNSGLSAGEVDEYTNEFHGYLDEQKREAFQRLNRLLGDGGIIDHDMLRDHVVILVSDGLLDGTVLDMAQEFLKPIRLKRLVIAVPLAVVDVVDKMHIMADELHVLDVKADMVGGVNHYYEQNDVPSREEAVATINEIILKWR